MKDKKLQGIIVLTATAFVCSTVLYLVMRMVEG